MIETSTTVLGDFVDMTTREFIGRVAYDLREIASQEAARLEQFTGPRRGRLEPGPRDLGGLVFYGEVDRE